MKCFHAKDRAAEVINCLSLSNWTSSCIITMVKFQNICGGPDEATVILSYLIGCGKARYLSKEKKELLEVCHHVLLHISFFI